MPLLKNHLLIHVDCTELLYNFRNELFMASRDRLKAGDSTNELRQRVATALIKGELSEIYKQRKNAISVEGGDAKDLLKAFSKNLPFNKDLMKLLSQTFKIEKQDEQKKDKAKPEQPKQKKDKVPFNPKRFPSFFNLRTGKDNKFLIIPEHDEKTAQFATDVENNYFDRADDPGELKIAILQFRQNGGGGGDRPGPVDDPSTLIDVRKASPKDGTIRVSFGATEKLKAGDEIEVEAALKPESLITSISTNVPRAHEIDPAALSLFDVYCDYRKTAPITAGEMILAAEKHGWKKADSKWRTNARCIQICL